MSSTACIWENIPMHFEALPADTFTFDHAYMVLDSTDVHLAVGDPDMVFKLASVTKPIGAWAALIAIDQGKISLDDDAGPAGSTVRHLLAHTSGVPMSEGKPIAEPGKRRIYSNYGFDLLAQAVEKAVGTSIQDWVKAQVLDPLEMDTATVAGSIAYSGVSSLDSLAKFAQELLNPTLISADLAEQATTPEFDGLAGILPGFGRQKNNLWGLGLEIRGEKDPHWTGSDFSAGTFGHFGQAGSFIWVDPEIKRAGIFLGDKAFSEEHAEVWPSLTNEMRAI